MPSLSNLVAHRKRAAGSPAPETDTAEKPKVDLAKRLSKLPSAKAPESPVALDSHGELRRSAPKRRLPVRKAPLLLAALTVLLGVLAAWSATQAERLRDSPAAHNAALTDSARTSEVNGQVTDAINTLFSYDHANPAKTDQAAAQLLVGDAVQQYAGLFAQVREQAPKQKLVLTTTVSSSAVMTLDGDRARVLVFADQRGTRTDNDDTTVAAAMLAVDVVQQDGRWRITRIDTLNVSR